MEKSIENDKYKPPQENNTDLSPLPIDHMKDPISANPPSDHPSEQSSSSFTIRQYLQECVWPGLGLFGESYLLFSIGILKPVWQMIYPDCFVTLQECPSSLLYGLTYSVVLGVIFGMLVLGTLANELGRRKGSILTAFLMSLSSFCMMILTMALSHRNPDILFRGIVICLFVFGIGVGGEYPLSASSASERAMDHMRTRMMEVMKAESLAKQNQERYNIESSLSDETQQTGNKSKLFRERYRDQNRGKTILLVFSMQGVGIFFNTLTITLLLLLANQFGQDGDLDGEDGNLGGVYNSTILLNIWRFIYFFATSVLCYVLYSRYFYLEESVVWKQDHNSKQLTQTIEKENVYGEANIDQQDLSYYEGDVLEVDRSMQSDSYLGVSKYHNYVLLMKNYWHRLFGTSMTWLLWDIAFYGNKLYQSKFLLALTGNDTTLIQLTGGRNQSIGCLSSYFGLF